MNSKPKLAGPTAPDPDDGHRDEIDAFVARNRDVLNASIAQAREEFARGIVSDKTIEEIIAAGRKRHRKG